MLSKKKSLAILTAMGLQTALVATEHAVTTSDIRSFPLPKGDLGIRASYNRINDESISSISSRKSLARLRTSAPSVMQSDSISLWHMVQESSTHSTTTMSGSIFTISTVYCTTIKMNSMPKSISIKTPSPFSRHSLPISALSGIAPAISISKTKPSSTR